MQLPLSSYKPLVIDNLTSAKTRLSGAEQPVLLMLNPAISAAIGVQMFDNMCKALKNYHPEQSFVSAYVAHDNIGKVMAGTVTTIDAFFLDGSLPSFHELQSLLSEHGKLLLPLSQLEEIL